jgi:hypothetical protein
MHSLHTRSYHYEMQEDYGTLTYVILTVYVLVYCKLPQPQKISENEYFLHNTKTFLTHRNNVFSMLPSMTVSISQFSTHKTKTLQVETAFYVQGLSAKAHYITS